MGENSREIQRLIQLKNERPAFARMISWEMGQATDTQYGKRGRPKKKKQGGIEDIQNQVAEENDDDEDCKSTGSSDYETANEEVIDELELSGAFSSINTETSFDTADIAREDDIDIDSEDEDLDNEDEIAGATNSAGGGLQPGRRRRPSKRQKRKKRESYKVIYTEEFLNLGNLFDMTDDIDSAFTETSEIADSVEVSCRVPSLAELCLQATRRKRQRNKSGPKPNVTRPLLPYGIKKVISDWRFNQGMLEKQLSYLQNIVLPSLCIKDGVKKNAIYKELPCGKYEFCFPVRSAWCALAFPEDHEDGWIYPSGKSTAYLYTPPVRDIPDEVHNVVSNYTNINYLDYYNTAYTHNLSAVATTIDLMLPSTLSDRGRSRSSSTDTDAIAASSQTMILRVRSALRARYPQLIDELFDRVIPYVMWARGNVGQATNMFQALVQNETNDVYKAMYLSEIAVMHAMFGEDQTAASFYRLAAEVAVTSEPKEEVIMQSTEQTQILLASIHDCGVMSGEKAQAAVSRWSNAVTLPEPKPATVMGAVDSFLCYHLRQGTDDCWNEAERRLRIWLKANKHRYLGYYTALVLALRGSDLDSTREYREFRASGSFGSFLPGDNVTPYMEKSERKNPWNPLVKTVKNQREPVKPLKVIWRTQLRPPRLTADRPMETDLYSHDVNLRVSESGHLTGDMQMLMPPIREVTLDLHTGSLVLNNTPSYTGTWKKDTSILNSSAPAAPFVLPTPYEIYCHDNGTKVHLMNPCLDPCHAEALLHGKTKFLPACPMVVTWKGPDGQTARINLIAALKNMQKKKLQNLTLGQLPGGRTEEHLEIIKAMIDIAFNKNLSLNIIDMYNAADSIKRRKKTEKKLKCKEQREAPKKQVSKEKMMRSLIPSDLNTLLPAFRVKLCGSPLQFGQAVVLLLEGPGASNNNYLFLDTSSREAFLDYKLMPKYHTEAAIKQTRLGSNATENKFFMTYLSNDEVGIYNEKGDWVQTLDIKDLKRNSHPDQDVNLFIVGDCIFSLNKSRLSIWKHLIGFETDGLDFEVNMSVTSLAPYWELEDGRKQIDQVLALGTEVKGKGQFLFLHMSVGLGLMDPDTMEMIPISLPEDCSLTLTEDGKVILADYTTEVKLLAEKSFIEEGTSVYRFAVGTENKLFLFSVSHKIGSDQLHASLLQYFFLPGIVKEVCIVGKEVGLLVCLTQHQDTDENYREHVFHFRNDGFLHGVLLCLGHGPHSFCPVYIGEGADISNGPGWNVYLRDGRDGILAVKLFQ